MAKSTLQRSTLWMCPLCLKNDTDRSVQPSLDAFARGWWHAAALRTCHVHGVSLAVLPSEPKFDHAHDIARRLRPVLGRLDDIATNLLERDPSPLERFVSDRLSGRDSGNPCLEELGLHAVTKTSEAIGAFELFGRDAPFDTISSDDWWRAGREGFPIVAQGPTAISNWMLEHYRAPRKDAFGTSASWAVFGTFSSWLSHAGADFAPIRHILSEAVFSTTPLASGATAFGVRLERRRLWSVKSAADTVKRTCEHVAQLALNDGLLRELPALPYNKITFPADGRADLVLKKARDVANRNQAAKFLGLSNPWVSALVEGGLLSTQMDRPISPIPFRFWIEELSQFRNRVLSRSERLHVHPSNHLRISIAFAAKRYALSIVEIFIGILENRLVAYYIDRNDPLSELRIDRNKLLDYRASIIGLNFNQITQKLGADCRTISALIDNGYLTTTKSDRSRVLVLVTPESLDEFEGNYIIEAVMAKALGLSTVVLRRVLREKNVYAICIRGSYHAALSKNSSAWNGCYIYSINELKKLSGKIVVFKPVKIQPTPKQLAEYSIIF